MSDYKTELTSREDCDGADHDFGLVDSKGRRMGCRVATAKVTYTDISDTDPGCYSTLAPGVHYRWTACATRDGASFGPGAGGDFSTASERDAAVAKYLKGARKRAERKGTPS